MIPDIEINIPYVVVSDSEEETRLIGKRLSQKLRRGDIVSLFGDLGSGKTRFVQGICNGLRVDEPVVSPTFTIINQYAGRNGDHRVMPVHHIDCYRLRTTGELIDIGVDEILSSDGVSMIEWPELALPLIRGKYWKVFIETGDDEQRRIIRIDQMYAGGDDGSRN